MAPYRGASRARACAVRNPDEASRRRGTGPASYVGARFYLVDQPHDFLVGAVSRTPIAKKLLRTIHEPARIIAVVKLTKLAIDKHAFCLGHRPSAERESAGRGNGY